MIFKKTLVTKHLSLSINITHNGSDDHSKIVASEQSARDFENLINDSMSYLYNRIKSWENEHKNKIEQVGK